MIPARTDIVESIAIDGHRNLPLARLREVMQTKLGASVDSAKLATDRNAIKLALSERGYLAAEVAAPVVTFGPSGGVFVVIDVDRGPLYRIRSVTLDGPSWKDAGVVTVTAGDDALADRLARARQSAEDTLARHGKHLHVSLELVPDHTDATVDVRLITH